MVVEGDEKTEDIKTVLRNSLETTLAARVDGCKAVRGVVEAEAGTLASSILDVKNQIAEIVKRWIEKAAFVEGECPAITESAVTERLGALSNLKTSLEDSKELVGQLGDLVSKCYSF